MINPFAHKKTFKEKVASSLKTPPILLGKKKKEKRVMRTIQQIILYISLFLAGYLVAKIQTLFQLAQF